MSTYCISDIHGNLRALQALLVETDFRYDGSDQLFLLGDYVDWGPAAIDTLQYVMRLSGQPYVTCLMGNHDLMFLNEIECSDCGRMRQHFDHNWLYSNRGIRTWEQYISLPMEEREQIYQWLLGLPYSAEVCVNDRWYLLGHAGPYLPEKHISKKEQYMKQLNAVWYRIGSPYENPLAQLNDRFPHAIWEKHDYVQFICGHSITYHYMNVPEGEAYSIFSGQYFTDLDCGAKCMGLKLNRDSISEDVIRRCRLSALRLEDGKQFYCDRKRAGYEHINEMRGTD